MPASGALPEEIVEAIAVSNAKSIGEQPAILANLALANEIANANLAQQNAITNQQAMFQLQMATVAKCVELIATIDPNNPKANDQIEMYKKLMDQMVDIFNKMSPNVP
jgi:hypothetical protein